MISATFRKTMLIAIAGLSLLTTSAAGQTASDKLSVNEAEPKQAAAPAQPAAERKWYYIVETNLKPGVLNDYMAFRVKERVPALKKGGVKRQDVWVPAVGPVGRMFTIQPLEGLGELDGPSALNKALGEEGVRALSAKTSPYLAGGGHTYLVQSRPDLSWMPTITAPPKFAIVARVKVARGRGADFVNYIKNDYQPIVKKSGALGYNVLQLAYGGDTSDYITLTFFNNFADIEKNDPGMGATMTRIVGAETAQKYVQKTVGVILEVERNILRFRPEWSVMP